MHENKEKSLSLLDIPKDIIENVLSPLLSLQELSRLVRTYKNGNFFNQPLKDRKQTMLMQLLEHVAFGQQEQAEEILKIHPELLLQSGIVKDYSDRFFEDITAFQYALWVLDRHMWTMILKYLPQDEAKKQLQEHLDGKKKYITLHGEHYNFDTLMQPLNNCFLGCSEWSRPELIEYWYTKVDDAQCLVPVHVANEYCRTDRLIIDNPGLFLEDNLPRALSFLDVYTNTREDWFPLSPDRKALPPITLTILPGGAIKHREPPSEVLLYKELEFLNKLSTARTNEFNQLKKDLLSIKPSTLTKEQELNSAPQKKSSCMIS